MGHVPPFFFRFFVGVGSRWALPPLCGMALARVLLAMMMIECREAVFFSLSSLCLQPRSLGFEGGGGGGGTGERKKR